MPVAECQQRVSVAEFYGWLAFHSLEPWGDDADNMRAAVVASYAQASMHGRPQPGKVLAAHFTPKHRAGRSWVTDPERIRAAFLTMGARPRE